MHTPRAEDWAELSRRLRRCAIGLTGNATDADDLAQQTLVTLLDRQPDLVGHLGYARRTMVRLWLDRQRTLRRRMARAWRVAAGRAAWREDADATETAEQLARVAEAAAALPPRQRAALVLRLVEELDYADIARVLGCSVAAVRSNLHHARARIRRAAGDRP